MMRPPITVLMPVYNTAPYLAACLDSVLAQTFTDFRLLCCNDASTDDSPAILARYANRDARITVLQNEENRGYAYTYNRLINSAETKYVAFCDADDLIHRKRLAYQYDFMEHNQAIDIVGTWIKIFTNQQNLARVKAFTYYRDDRAIKSGLLFSASLGNATVLIRTATLPADIRHDEKRWGRGTAAYDYDLWCHLAPHVRFANIPKALYYYRRHDTQMSTAGNAFQLQTALEIAQGHLARFNVNADPETIHAFCIPSLFSRDQTTAAQREKFIQLLEQIQGIQNFYGYPGVSRHVFNYIRGVLLPYLLRRSRLHALLSHDRMESLSPIYTRILRNKIVQRLLARKQIPYLVWRAHWSDAFIYRVKLIKIVAKKFAMRIFNRRQHRARN